MIATTQNRRMNATYLDGLRVVLHKVSGAIYESGVAGSPRHDVHRYLRVHQSGFESRLQWIQPTGTLDSHTRGWRAGQAPQADIAWLIVDMNGCCMPHLLSEPGIDDDPNIRRVVGACARRPPAPQSKHVLDMHSH